MCTIGMFSLCDNLLRSIREECLDPCLCFALNAIVVHLVEKLGMTDPVECFTEVHDQYISLKPSMHVVDHICGEFK